jgi:hypothetical protein
MTQSPLSVTMTNGDRFRCRCEKLTAAQGRWVCTGPDGLAHVGPVHVPNEPAQATVERIRQWWRVREAAGHWRHGRVG